METRWTKVRVSEMTPVFAEEQGNTPPILQLPAGEVIEIGVERKGATRVPAILANGTYAFVPEETPCLTMKLWTLSRDGYTIYTQPSLQSVPLGTPPGGTTFEQYSRMLTAGDGSKWFQVRLEDGSLGFLPSGTEIIVQGSQVRVQKKPNTPGKQCVLKDGKLSPRKKRYLSSKQAARAAINVGIIVLALGAFFMVAGGISGIFFGGISAISGISSISKGRKRLKALA